MLMASADGPTASTPPGRGKPKGDKRERTRARAARGRTRVDSGERLRANDAGGSGQARRHDDGRDLRELQESRRAVHRARAGVLGADRSPGPARRNVRRGHARVCQGDARGGGRPRTGRCWTTDGACLRVDQSGATRARSRGHERELRIRRRVAAHVPPERTADGARCARPRPACAHRGPRDAAHPHAGAVP